MESFKSSTSGGSTKRNFRQNQRRKGEAGSQLSSGRRRGGGRTRIQTQGAVSDDNVDLKNLYLDIGEVD